MLKIIKEENRKWKRNTKIEEIDFRDQNSYVYWKESTGINDEIGQGFASETEREIDTVKGQTKYLLARVSGMNRKRRKKRRCKKKKKKNYMEKWKKDKAEVILQKERL